MVGGTSGYNHGAVCYQPWNASDSLPHTGFAAYGDPSYNLYDQTGKADWGYNRISNGGLKENLWRTLKAEEWEYIINYRNTASGIRYAHAQIRGDDFDIRGLLLLPDTWSASYYTLDSVNTSYSDYINCINDAEWDSIFKPNGAVFLPESCLRLGTDVFNPFAGWYWSSSRYNNEMIYSASCLLISTTYYIGLAPNDRYSGLSVRLVHDAK